MRENDVNTKSVDSTESNDKSGHETGRDENGFLLSFNELTQGPAWGVLQAVPGIIYVAMTYPWGSAVYYWSRNNLNDIAEMITDANYTEKIIEITNVVNKRMTYSEKEKRVKAFENWYTDFPR